MEHLTMLADGVMKKKVVRNLLHPKIVIESIWTLTKTNYGVKYLVFLGNCGICNSPQESKVGQSVI